MGRRTKEWGTPTEAAEVLGIARQVLARQLPQLQALGAAQQGGNGRWLVRLETLKADWALVRPGSPAAAPPPAEDPPADGEEAIPPQHVSKARREHYLAEMAEMEAKRRAGELIEVSFVSREVFRLSREFRDRLIGRPPQWAPELLGLETVGEIEIKLEQFVRAFLADLTSPDRGLSARVDQALARGAE